MNSIAIEIDNFSKKRSAPENPNNDEDKRIKLNPLKMMEKAVDLECEKKEIENTVKVVSNNSNNVSEVDSRFAQYPILQYEMRDCKEKITDESYSLFLQKQNRLSKIKVEIGCLD
jgi:hypothetical protein